MNQYNLVDEMHDESIATDKTRALDAIKQTPAYIAYVAAWSRMQIADADYRTAEDATSPHNAAVVAKYHQYNAEANAQYPALNKAARDTRGLVTINRIIDAAQADARTRTEQSQSEQEEAPAAEYAELYGDIHEHRNEPAADVEICPHGINTADPLAGSIVNGVTVPPMPTTIPDNYDPIADLAQWPTEERGIKWHLDHAAHQAKASTDPVERSFWNLRTREYAAEMIRRSN